MSALLGGFGELLITLGVIGLLFVVWEVWWTGLDAGREAREAEEEFYSSVQDSGESTEICSTLPDGGGVPCPDNMRSALEEDGAVAIVYAPRLGESWSAPVREGVEQDVLNAGGLGHYPETQLPGEAGNFALAGHRLTYGDVLRDQDSLLPGDTIYVYTPDGYYTYEVSESLIVLPHQSEVIAPVPGAPGEEPEQGDSVLTLTTCHPLFSNRERLITHADLVSYTSLNQDPPPELTDRLSADGAQDGPTATGAAGPSLTASSLRGSMLGGGS